MEQENTNSFMFKNSGKYEREDSVLFINTKITSAGPNGLVFDETNPEWTPVGEDNDEITRTTNNEIESKKNVLGKNNITHTAGAETTEIDPIAIRGNDKLSYILYIIHKYKLVGAKATIQCMEASLFDEQTDGVFGSFTEHAVVDLKSWGGNTAEIDAPISLNWKGDRVHGTYNLESNTFTKITEG